MNRFGSGFVKRGGGTNERIENLIQEKALSMEDFKSSMPEQLARKIDKTS